MNVKDIPVVCSITVVPRSHPIFKLSLDELKVLEGALLVERAVLAERMDLVANLIAGQLNRRLNAARSTFPR